MKKRTYFFISKHHKGRQKKIERERKRWWWISPGSLKEMWYYVWIQSSNNSLYIYMCEMHAIELDVMWICAVHVIIVVGLFVFAPSAGVCLLPHHFGSHTYCNGRNTFVILCFIISIIKSLLVRYAMRMNGKKTCREKKKMSKNSELMWKWIFFFFLSFAELLLAREQQSIDLKT